MSLVSILGFRRRTNETHGATSYSQYGQIRFSQIQIGTVPLLVDETLQVQCPACEGQLD